MVINHQSAPLKGKRLLELFDITKRQPAELRKTYASWKKNPGLIDQANPIMVFAVLGQAKSDNDLNPSDEHHLLTHQLNRWADHR